MLRRFVHLAVAVACLVPGAAFADEAKRGQSITRHPSKSVCFLPASSSTGDSCTATPILDDIALNDATTADRTVVFTLDKMFSKLIVVTDYTNSTATTVDVDVTVSVNGSPDAVLQSGAISSGTRTLSDFTDTKAVSGDKVFTSEYDVRGLDSITLVWSGTSAGGSDTIAVYAVAITGN